MERETTKHGPREDEDLARNVEGLLRGAPVEPRSAENRRLEDPGDAGNDEFEDAVRPDVPSPGVLDERALNERAELARLLTGLHYPADREAIVEVAGANGAEEATLARLGRLPEGSYDLFEAVWEALGGQPD